LIVVCGEALIDLVDNGDGTQRSTPGGGPYNTARGLARLGVPTAFLGRLSDDAFGRELADCLAKDGVSLELASIGSEPTTIAAAVLDPDGLAEYEFLVAGTSAPYLTPEMVPDEFRSEVDAIHVGTLGLVLEPMASTLSELVAHEAGRRLVMLDPNIRSGLIDDGEYRRRLHGLLRQSTLVKASLGDLAWLYPEVQIEALAENLLAEGVRLVVVTMGADGAFAASRRASASVPAVRVKVVDTIGAGDAFGAAVLAWLHDHGAVDLELDLETDQLETALSFACRAAAITCTRAGAEPPWRWELEPVRPNATESNG
jgi:fructokinase